MPPRLSRTVLYRIVLSEDFTEMASGSPSQRSNRLYSTTAWAPDRARPLTPRRMGSPPLDPVKLWSEKWFRKMWRFWAMAVAPGPSTTMKMPAVVLSWKWLRSIFVSSARTTTQYGSPLSANWKSLRVSRIDEQSAGISSVVLCRKEKPLRVMWLDPLSAKPRSPRSTAPPRLWETMVMGAASVPFLPVMVRALPEGTV